MGFLKFKKKEKKVCRDCKDKNWDSYIAAGIMYIAAKIALHLALFIHVWRFLVAMTRQTFVELVMLDESSYMLHSHMCNNN